MAVPSKMRALVIKSSGQAPVSISAPLETYLELKEIKVPEPGADQVLIKVSMASVNPSDIIFAKGHQGRDRIKGRPAGTEGTGIVVASGNSAAARELMGKRVAFYSASTLWGAWAEYAVADATFCMTLLDSIEEIDAAAMMINPVAALAMLDIVRAAGARSYVIAGAATQISKLVISAGAEEALEAICIVRLHYQIPRLKTSGAAHVLNTQAPDCLQSLENLIASERPKVLLDGVTGPLPSQIFGLMPEQAQWVIYGQLDTNTTTITQPSQMILQGKRIDGFYLPAWLLSAGERRIELEREAQNRFVDGRWKTDVTATIPLAEAIDQFSSALVESDGKAFLQIA